MKKRLFKYCKVCNKQFYKKTTVSLKEWNKVTKYCSINCKNKAHSQKMKGKKLKYDISGENNPNFKYKLSKKFLVNEYVRNNKTIKEIANMVGCCVRPIRKWLKKYNIPIKNHSQRHRGRLSGTYNDKLTTEDRLKERNYFEYKIWRKKVYERDNYTCQACNKRGGDLNAHHIKSYKGNPKLRTKLSNGMTLCRDCHENFHHWFGYKDNTKEQLNKFIKEVRKDGN